MIPAAKRAEGIQLLFLMLLAGVAELVTVGSLVPFLTLLVSGDAPASTAPIPYLPKSLPAAAALFLGAALLAGAARLLLSWRTQSFAHGTGHWIAREVHRRILLQDYSWHVRTHSSTLLSALQKVQDVVWGVLLPVVQGAAALVMIVLILAMLLWLDPAAATIAALLFGSLYLLTSFLIRRKLRSDAGVVAAAYDQRLRIMQDSLGGIRDVIIDGSQAVHLSTFGAVDGRLAAARMRLGFLNVAPRFIIEALGLGVVLLLTLLLASREGGLVAALPVLGALALGAQRLLPLLQQLYASWSGLSGNSQAVRDLAQLLALPVGSDEAVPSPALPFGSEIRLENIRFTYPGRDVPALDDVTVEVRKGSRVALTGRTGSGKSTLADLLMGLLEPESGRLLVDGRELTPAELTAWRRNIAHVPQSIFLTDASIAENIAFGVPRERIDRNRLLLALKIAQLEEDVEALPEGAETRIGERGARLSGGQRQRLALARAIYRNKPVLVLDEATSALDDRTEAAILKSLQALQREGVTIIVIAHRSSILEGCDAVVRLERGRLVPASEHV